MQVRWDLDDNAEIRGEALDALTDALRWKLADERWQEIHGLLATMAEALETGDVAALAEATTHLELAGPLRITPIGAASGPPREVRVLVADLVHTLGGVTADQRPDEPGDTGAAGAGLPRS
jgi:hypothetical protein